MGVRAISPGTFQEITMAHELSFTTNEQGTQTADMFSVLETPWHQEGTLLTEHPTLDRAIEVAHLDYRVEKLPVTITLPTVDGTDTYEKQSDVAFVTMRMDRQIELGSVGPQYQVVQNVDAFRATVGPLVDEGVLLLETGGVLRNGADAWILGRFDVTRFGPIVREVFADEVIPFALVKVNHSGRRNNEIALTPIRVVCANTLGMAEREIDGGHGKAASVRHVGAAEARMVEAAQNLFGGIIERYEIIATQYRALKNFYLDEAMFRELVIEPALGAHPSQRKGWNPEARQADVVIERYETRVAEVSRLWTAGKGHAGDHSAWEAYNGLVEAIDHNAELFPTKSGVYRTQALMEGTLRDQKQAALVELVGAAERR
jgi:phage/plasmid-like protein (TIGR03299 family)